MQQRSRSQGLLPTWLLAIAIRIYYRPQALQILVVSDPLDALRVHRIELGSLVLKYGELSGCGNEWLAHPALTTLYRSQHCFASV